MPICQYANIHAYKYLICSYTSIWLTILAIILIHDLTPSSLNFFFALTLSKILHIGTAKKNSP